jgi:uncharacterized protein (TIGR00730 family)
MKKVSVYAASSTQVAECYKRAAYRLGEILSANNIHCLYGGGSVGLMGELSKAMLKNGGVITGVIPQFMVNEGWGNEKVEQIVVNTMHERKRLMLEGVDAAIAMPGGCGTLEELMEAITWKQLGIFTKPIIILNANRYFDPLLEMLDKAIAEKFMRAEHRSIWSVVQEAEEVLPAIKQAKEWRKDAIGFAAL